MKTKLDNGSEALSYCPNCRCSYVTWLDECPSCGTPFDITGPPAPAPTGPRISYDELLARVTEAGGVLKVELTVAQVERVKKSGFPYLGYGFAWEKRLVGALDGSPVEVKATEVSMSKRIGFPYAGFGFAWVRAMEGHVAGNEIELRSTAVEMKKNRGFPYFGYGYAWTREMIGTCGDRLRATLVATSVETSRRSAFPYRGFGFAWVSRATLTLKLTD